MDRIMMGHVEFVIELVVICVVLAARMFTVMILYDVSWSALGPARETRGVRMLSPSLPGELVRLHIP